MAIFLFNVIALGLIYWVITLIPVLPGVLKQVLMVFFVIVAVLWMFQFFGVNLPVKVPYLFGG